MANTKNRGLRKAQVITSSAPGAIVDISSESFVVCGIEEWRTGGLDSCRLPRLSRFLEGIKEFRQPKTSKESFYSKTVRPSVVMRRFPEWLFCQHCRKMKQWKPSDESTLPIGTAPECRQCRIGLVPMRFVRVCANGHMSDIDWWYWVHSTEAGGDPHTQQCRDSTIYFKSDVKGGGSLASIYIECGDCGLKKNLKDITLPARFGQCKPPYSRHPWQHPNDPQQDCGERWVVVQRGDSNVHFPQELSALDIPDSSIDEGRISLVNKIRDENKFLIRLYEKKEKDDGRAKAIELINQSLEEISHCDGIPIDFVTESICGTAPDDYVDSDDPDSELRCEEYPALNNPEQSAKENFAGTHYEVDSSDFGSALSSMINSVSLLNKLRHVRVFRGFHRLNPSGKDTMVPASTRQPPNDWLPAYEVFGEGIFINFDYNRLASWAHNLPAKEKRYFVALEQRLADSDITFLPPVRAIHILLHGFAHLLMKQLCFDCGYASASLRERLYVHESPKMSGVLIYTADGDSEGSLGGLVRQGEPDKLPNIIKRSLHEATWCSGDPLCLEGQSQGLAGLNRSACHACLLVSETSCECANTLLDRRLLVGDGKTLDGYFDLAMREAGIR